MISVNKRAYEIVRCMIDDAEALSISCEILQNGATVIDSGVMAPGSLEAGRLFSEICLGGLGSVGFCRLDFDGISLPGVTVAVNHPTISCMGSQYAGWAFKVKGENKSDTYFAMGSGPARALYGKEPIYQDIGYRDQADIAILLLESRKLPDERVAQRVASKCDVVADHVYLLVAPTASLVGSVQVAARVVETGLHKMHEVGFDINSVVSGFGTCPLAFIAKKDLKAIGRTNDTVLYAGQAWYTVKADDNSIEAVIDKLPSSASKDHGAPFYELFKRCDGDFYKIDPLLFSPAEISINNINSGHTFHAGQVDPALIRKILLK